MKRNKDISPLQEAIASVFPALKRAFVFSVFVNVLVLAPSAYMLEVYDRVVNSRSHSTLLMLTILVIVAYMMLESLEWVRRQILHHAGDQLDRKLRDQTFNAVFAVRQLNLPAIGGQALRDLKIIRDFLPSQAMLGIIDVPLALLVLILIFSMNQLLGWFAVGGAIAQFTIGFVNERRISKPLTLANQNAASAQSYADDVLRNAQVIESMGMLSNIHQRWMNRQQKFLMNQAIASDHAGTNSALSKLLQSLMGSVLLGFGAWLTLKGELTGAGMIVGSILGGRVLAPLVQVIGGWRQVVTAKEAFVRLDNLLKEFPGKKKGMSLPAPDGRLTVEGVFAGPPRSTVQILKGVSFKVEPGSSLAIVGPSASGKTTLARLLVGFWPSLQGKVRLDGNDIYQWDKEELGQYIGYLPQNVELFAGTIAENIARFGDPDSEKVYEACRLVGLDGFVTSLPDGIETRIGDDGSFLSGGERQRVALARAVYGMPKLLVLDEPNSSLDEAGDSALLGALMKLKAQGATIVVITHRLNILKAIDNMLALVDGRIQMMGTVKEVLTAMQNPSSSKQPTAKPVEARSQNLIL